MKFKNECHVLATESLIEIMWVNSALPCLFEIIKSQPRPQPYMSLFPWYHHSYLYYRTQARTIRSSVRRSELSALRCLLYCTECNKESEQQKTFVVVTIGAWESLRKAIWNIWPHIKGKAAIVRGRKLMTHPGCNKKYWHCFDTPHLYVWIKIVMLQLKQVQPPPHTHTKKNPVCLWDLFLHSAPCRPTDVWHYWGRKLGRSFSSMNLLIKLISIVSTSSHYLYQRFPTSHLCVFFV